MTKVANAQSPMMVKFRDMKAKHPDVLLLFRCGDFYETYEQDAEDASTILGITLTKNSKGIRMAGFPYMALDCYMPKLIRAGKRVAICDQIEETEMCNTNNLFNNENNETMEKKEEVTREQVEGIAVETLKSLNGTLPSSLNKRFSDALGMLKFINLKYTNNGKIFPDEMAYLIKWAEKGLASETNN